MKAPGLDGFSSSFFHTMWDLTESEVTQAVIRILNESGELDMWNDTVIILIPKKKKAESMKDFRPISLCNVCYKIAAKAIANRWRSVLDRVIDQNQSAFIPGRLISDNIHIAFEFMHWLRLSKSSEGYTTLN